MKVTITYNIDFNDRFSQLSRCFVTKMVDSDGQGWTGVWSQFGHFLVIFEMVWLVVCFVGKIELVAL